MAAAEQAWLNIVLILITIITTLKDSDLDFSTFGYVHGSGSQLGAIRSSWDRIKTCDTRPENVLKL